MSKFETLTYYEILDIPVKATPFEIREAYKTALSIYSEDALATYSFFSKQEREAVLDRIEEAFQVLLDEDRRVAYDRRLVTDGKIAAATVERKEKRKTVPLFQIKSGMEKNAVRRRIQDRIQEKNIRAASDSLLSKSRITGKDLKSLREAMDIGIEEVYEITRITATTLNAIEDDDYAKLPSAIYLKNFIKSYAELLQLDEKKTVMAYMKNISQKTNT